MLLDRDADVFLARRSDADGWLVKPLDAFALRAAAAQILSAADLRIGGRRPGSRWQPFGRGPPRPTRRGLAAVRPVRPDAPPRAALPDDDDLLDLAALRRHPRPGRAAVLVRRGTSRTDLERSAGCSSSTGPAGRLVRPRPGTCDAGRRSSTARSSGRRGCSRPSTSGMRRTVATGSWLTSPAPGAGHRHGDAGRRCCTSPSMASAPSGRRPGPSRTTQIARSGSPDQRVPRRTVTTLHVATASGVSARWSSCSTGPTWEPHRRDDIELVGLEPCLPLFGLSGPSEGFALA